MLLGDDAPGATEDDLKIEAELSSPLYTLRVVPLGARPLTRFAWKLKLELIRIEITENEMHECVRRFKRF